MPIPAAPVVDSYDATTHTIGGSAEADATVTLFDNGVQVATTTAESDGDWSIALGSLSGSGDHAFTATATNSDGTSGTEGDVLVRLLPSGGYLMAGRGDAISYSFIGTQFADKFNIDGDTVYRGGIGFDFFAGKGGSDEYYDSGGVFADGSFSEEDIIVELNFDLDARDVIYTNSQSIYELQLSVEDLVGLGRLDMFGTNDQNLTGNQYDNLIVAPPNRGFANTLAGGDGNDTIIGGSGSDDISGEGGNDSIDGGSGANDSARYSGNRNDYVVTTNGAGTFFVTDVRPSSPDGQDTVTGIEEFRFANGFFDADDVADPIMADSDPVARDDEATTQSERLVEIFVLANDTDADGDSLDVLRKSDPAHGSNFIAFGLDEGYRIQYLPDPGFIGTDSFTYTIRDEDGVEATATVTVTVTARIEDPDTPLPVLGEMPASEVPFTFANSSSADLTDVIGLDGGGYVALWTALEPLTRAPMTRGQLYGADGEKIDGNILFATDKTSSVAGTSLPDGGFVVAWSEDRENGAFIDNRESVIIARVFNTDGSVRAADIDVNSATYDDLSQGISIATLASGDFAIAWQGGDTLEFSSVYARRFDASGNPLDGEDVEISANSEVFFSEGPEIVSLAGGGYAVAWEFDRQMNFRSVDASGAVLDNEVVIDTPGSFFNAEFLQLAPSANGGFVAAFAANDIFVQEFGSDLQPVSSAITVNDPLYGGTQLDIAARPDDGYVVTWGGFFPSLGGRDILAQYLDATLERIGDPFRVSESRFFSQVEPAAASLANGDVIFAWQGFGVGQQTGAFTRIFTTTPQENTPPVAHDDVFSFTEDQPTRLDVLVNDSDADGDRLVNTLVFGEIDPGSGSFIQSADGTVSFNPALDFTGEISFLYEVSDGRGGTDIGEITLNILAAVDPEPSSAEMTTNFSTLGIQSGQHLVKLAGGGFLQVWVNIEAGEVTGRRFDAAGTPIDGADFVIGSAAGANAAARVTIIQLEGGDYIAVWNTRPTGSSQDVLGHRLDQNGNPIGTDFIVTQQAGDEQSISATALPGGGFAVVWKSTGGTEGVFGKIFASDGTVTAEVTVDDISTFSSFGVGTSVAPLTGGGFAVAYAVASVSDQFPDDGNLVLKRFDSSGNAIDLDPIDVGTSVRDRIGNAVENNPSFAALANGAVVLSWHDAQDDGFNSNLGGRIDARLLAADGSFASDEFQLNSSLTGSLQQASHALTPLSDGGFLATWSSFSGSSFGGSLRSKIVGQVFDAEGMVEGSIFEVSQTNDEIASLGSAIELEGGELVFGWAVGERFAADDDIAYRLFDASALIGPSNARPTAVNDTASLDEDAGPITISVLDNDSDPEGDAFSVTGNTAAANGAVTDNGDGNFSYAPNDNFNGSDSFTYTISDATGSATGTVSITVNPVNDPPILVGPTNITTDEDVAVQSVSGAGDPDDSDILSVGIKPGFGPAKGSVSFTGGAYVYTPDPDANGTDIFTILASDDKGASAEQAVTVTINPVNDAPIAVDDAVFATIDTARDYAAATLLANDSDADGDVLAITAVGGGVNGSASLNGTTVTFNPDAGFTGAASFTYTVSDGNGGTDTATVNVTVTEGNLPPVADAARSVTTLTNTALAFDIIASDPDGDALSYSAGAPANGAVSVAGGRVTYTPGAGFTGSDTFTVTIDDGNGGTATQEVTVTTQNLPPANQFVMFAADGFTGGAGGFGSVNGTDGFQQISVIDVAGSVALDPSFNRGGDIVQLAGNAAAWSITRSGSSALFSDGDTFVTVPIGEIGLAVQFDDGVRELIFDGSNFTIGGQIFAAGTLSPIDAAPGGTALPSGADPAAKAVLFIAADAQIAASGLIDIFGAAGNEVVSLISGNLKLDASFNRGGDTVRFDEVATDYLASQFGSSLQLTGSDTAALIPAGPGGATLSFGDGSDTRTLLLDTAIPAITIDGQVIGPDPVQLMAA